LGAVLDLGAAPVPVAPAPADTPGRAPSTAVADPAPSRAGITGTDSPTGGIDVGFAPLPPYASALIRDPPLRPD
jgi:hypothetical protein